MGRLTCLTRSGLRAFDLLNFKVHQHKTTILERMKMLFTVLWGVVGGVLGWFATYVIVEPLRQFFQLRNKAAQVIVQYDPTSGPTNPDDDPPEAKWLEDRRKEFDDIGVSILEFCAVNSIVCRTLSHRHLSRYRFSIRIAGESLRLLGKTQPGTQAHHQIRHQALYGLKLGEWPNGIL